MLILDNLTNSIPSRKQQVSGHRSADMMVMYELEIAIVDPAAN